MMTRQDAEVVEEEERGGEESGREKGRERREEQD